MTDFDNMEQFYLFFLRMQILFTITFLSSNAYPFRSANYLVYKPEEISFNLYYSVKLCYVLVTFTKRKNCGNWSIWIYET